MKTKAALLAIAFCVGASPCFAFDELPGLALVERAQLSGASIEAVERAMVIFRKQKIGWKNYKVAVAESDYIFQVEFWQPEREIVSHPNMLIRNGAWITKDQVPEGELTFVDRVGSFKVTFDKDTWHAIWTSLEGDKF